jgi:hypothetical protein
MKLMKLAHRAEHVGSLLRSEMRSPDASTT